MSRNHFVTGATGFVGGALVLELLKHTDDIIYCLVRGEDIDACNRRLKETLYLSSIAYGEDLNGLIDDRCFVVMGDLDDIGLPKSISDGTIKIDYIWHAAASLKYAEKDREHIEKVNIAGTKSLCELSNKLSVKHFNYISTAYVSGRMEGRIEEKLIDLDTPTSNYYEKSKIIAEHYLHQHCSANLKILRPSIVIGHSKTYVPTSFSGMYGFIIDLNIFRRKVEKELGFLLYHRPLKLISVPGDPINLIPIDYVAKAALHIGLSDTDKKVFHITNDTPGKVGEGIELIFKQMDFQTPLYVKSERAFTEIDRKLDENLDFYSSYLSGIKDFDRTNACAIKGVYQHGINLEREKIYQYIAWFMDYTKKGSSKSRLERDIFERALSLQTV